uniref:LRAT domain-containing protein n=1 Tax=Terrapene triunguis TaxID=2587831 RepID=A0A674I4G7_9SAUR
ATLSPYLIEIDRGFYKHWSVYVGDDDIVHITGEMGGFGSFLPALSIRLTWSIVKKQPLKRVVGNCNYRVNNKYDRTRQVYPVPKIIERATKEVGKTWTYHVFAKNCEHFATEIRYNEARSDQVCNWPGVGYCSLCLWGRQVHVLMPSKANRAEGGAGRGLGQLYSLVQSYVFTKNAQKAQFP